MTFRNLAVLTMAWLLAACFSAPSTAADWQFELTVAAGGHDRQQVPVRGAIDVPDALARHTRVELKDAAGRVLHGQLTSPGLLAAATDENGAENGTVTRQLHFVIDELPADESIQLTGTVIDDEGTTANSGSPTGFSWQDNPGESALLSLDGKPALEYMYAGLDESSPQTREETYKVFHHLYDPQGTRRVTKGPGGRYTHHRGLFYGFNRITYGDGHQVDTWHCKGDAHLSHAGFVSAEAGAVLGRHQVKIDWHGIDKEVFARERREMTIYHLPGGRLVEFASTLTGVITPVVLDGDPQHAGFQFRADNEVAAQTASQTYYLRPDGRGAPGATRNWPQIESHVNLPWNAMSFVLGERRYTAVLLDHPDNPKPARHSERDYGRFGSYFEYRLTDDRPLVLIYRLWLQEGELTAEQAEALRQGFVDPPQVVVQ